jgi:hypothetical protein
METIAAGKTLAAVLGPDQKLAKLEVKDAAANRASLQIRSPSRQARPRWATEHAGGSDGLAVSTEVPAEFGATTLAAAARGRAAVAAVVRL